MWSTAGGHIEFLFRSKYISKYKYGSRRSLKKGHKMAKMAEKDKSLIRIPRRLSQKEARP
jgi:hypothetical protein